MEGSAGEGASGGGVSVVLVSWNSRDDLPKALGSLLPLQGLEHEVVLVDNASTDGTAELVERDFPSVRVLRNARNLGFAGGVNVGIRATRLPFVLLLNPDAQVEPGAVGALVGHAARRPEVGIVGPRVLNPDGSLQSSRFRFPSLANLALSASYLYQLFPRSALWNRERFGGTPAAEPVATEAVSGCCFLVRRALLEEVGLLDETFFMYAEETDLCFRARRAGWQVHYVPQARVVHAGGGSSRLARRRNFLEFRRSILRFMHKHRGRPAAEAARVLLLLGLVLRLPYWSLRALGPGAGRAHARGELGNLGAALAFLSAPIPRLLAPPRAGDAACGAPAEAPDPRAR